MKTVLLQGGLGNQLFQLAWAYYIRDNEGSTVKLDMEMLMHEKQHKGVSFENLFGSDLGNIFLIERSQHVLNGSNIIGKMIRALMRCFNLRSFNGVLFDYDATTPFEYCELNKKDVYHYGYFQFVEAALFFRDFIRSSIFNLNEKCLNDFKIKYGDCVGIHIRRGDFLLSRNKLHSLPDKIDYLKAIKKFEGRKLVFFSDDITWCRKEFANLENVQFHAGCSAEEDFLALSTCRDFVLGGSTFSWWAAFLNASSKTKIVYFNDIPLYMNENSHRQVGWEYERIK
ncbi:alpha-1,2-fucosyltransferase [Vibrio alginolyticus]